MASATKIGAGLIARRSFVDLRTRTAASRTHCRSTVASIDSNIWRTRSNCRGAHEPARRTLVDRPGQAETLARQTYEKELPSSALAKAAGYCLNQWTALTRFVNDGRLNLDNNIGEQQLRDIALRRENFLFAGSHDAARRTATLYSLMRTCAQHGVPPLPYLTDVLRKLAHGWDTHRIEELLAERWQQLHGGTLSDVPLRCELQPINA